MNELSRNIIAHSNLDLRITQLVQIVESVVEILNPGNDVFNTDSVNEWESKTRNLSKLELEICIELNITSSCSSTKISDQAFIVNLSTRPDKKKITCFVIAINQKWQHTFPFCARRYFL